MAVLSTKKKQFARAGLLLILVAGAALEATSLIQYHYSKEGIRKEASLRATSELGRTKNEINRIIGSAETATQNSMWLGQWALKYPDSLKIITTRLVRDNPVIVGSTVALKPGYIKRIKYFSPYSYSVGDSVVVSPIVSNGEDYVNAEWYAVPMEKGSGYWSNPYLEPALDNELITTYSAPLRDKKGELAGVLTADVSLNWLSGTVNEMSLYPNSFNMLFGRNGEVIVSPLPALDLSNSYRDIIAGQADTTGYTSMIDDMHEGASGGSIIRYNGNKYHIFYSSIDRTGWSLCILIPESDMFGEIQKTMKMVGGLQILGLILLIVILYVVGANEARYDELKEKKDRMENELTIGRGIQMSMIPKIFPPFPERNDLDMTAVIVPAKEVGGDLYDFYIRENRLFFCIGDVSGKGVPASLVMAVTRSLFRTVSAHEFSPQRIVTSINDSMSDMNENNMFVTFFCGMLNLGTGHLRYCNAGHNPPILMTDEIRDLEVEPNLPLGIMKGMAYKEQEMDLKYDDALCLYTDGITEAVNLKNEEFGVKRLKATLHGRASAADHLERTKNAVKKFAGSAPQSDDITMLFIHYLNDMAEPDNERHLILHNDVQQIPQLAEFIETIAYEKKLDQSMAMSLNLALEEAVSNVIMYAYPDDSDGLVDVECVVRDDSLEFIITDSGKPFDPTQAPEADTALGVEDRPIGGLGIFLVKKIMDSVKYERNDGKNILHMNKKI